MIAPVEARLAPDAPTGGSAVGRADPARSARLRMVHRAIGELRRGAPVLLRGPAGHTWLVAAAETLGAGGAAAFASPDPAPPVLLLPGTRAAAILQRPVSEAIVALKVAAALTAPTALRRLADPTVEQLLALPAEVVAPPPSAAAAAAIRLVKLARVLPAALVTALADAAAVALAASHALLSVDISAIETYREDIAASLTRAAEAQVPLAASEDTRVVAFRPADGGIEHLAILVGRPEDAAAGGAAPLARLHSECFTGDLLDSLKCDCGPQLRGAIAAMAQEGSGVLLYLAQEGRGIGLVNKLRAYTLQDRGVDTLEANQALGFAADERSFAVAAAMLRALGIGRVRLLTNNPEKLAALAAHGIEVTGRVAHVFPTNGHNARYIATKAERFGHLFG